MIPNCLTPCYYCGRSATTVDHVIPRAMLETLKDDPVAYRDCLAGRRRMVPACKECNCLAGRSVQDDLEERKQFVKGKLRRRYQRYLDIPRWADDEVGSLGPALRKFVRRGLRIKALTLERLRW